MSTFDARPGTRGARQPSGRILTWINGFVARRVRKGRKTPGFDFDILLLTTTGRNSGLEQQLHGTEREAAWQTLATAIPRFGSYPEKTDREIPVIRLTARTS
jgi:hypothetical protein